MNHLENIGKYRHIFFDFDGTLCASGADIRNAWKNTLKEI